MMVRAARLAGLVVVLGLGAGGCSAHNEALKSAGSVAPSLGAVTASPSETRTPLQILLAGVPTESSPIYHYSIGADSGVIDPVDKIAELVGVQHFTGPSYTETTTTLLSKDKSWLKVKDVPAEPPGLEPMPKKWMLLNSKKIKSPNGKPFVYGAESDPGYTSEVFESATEAKQTSPGHFAGVTDLSASGADHVLTAAQLKALGSKAAHLNFTAVLDGQGRLTTTTVQLPAAGKAKATKVVVTYDQYGTAAKPKLPTAAETITAPSYIYDMYW
jgi:hypothetical protein